MPTAFVPALAARDLRRLKPEQFAASPEALANLTLETFEVDRLSAALFQATNRVRRRFDLPPFEPLPALDKAADVQASLNALTQQAQHVSPIAPIATPYDRIRRRGLTPRAVAENAAIVTLLAFDLSHGYTEQDTPQGRVYRDGSTGEVVASHTYISFATAVVESWMNSPGHRANILNPEFRYLGCSGRPAKSLAGLDVVACIQDFYTPQRDR